MNTEDVTMDFEDRIYVRPEISRDEQLAYLDTLKDIQAQNTQQINQNTYNLGSPVTSNVGGLIGTEGLWKAQYQTPQTTAQIADLRAIAQQTALNQAMQNINNINQNRYKQASRNYYRRAAKRGSSGSDVGPLGNTPQNAADPDIETIATDLNATQSGIGYEGYSYIPNPSGGDRWYKNLPNGDIDYENYVDKNPNTVNRYRQGTLIRDITGLENLSSRMRNGWTRLQNNWG